MPAALTPYERMVALYRERPTEEPFSNYVEWHLRNGFVFSRPDFFIMGRPVIKWAAPELIVDLTHRFPSSHCDCWYIFAMAGNMAKAWTIMPWELPWFAWERDQGGKRDLRFYSVATIKRLTLPSSP